MGISLPVTNEPSLLGGGLTLPQAITLLGSTMLCTFDEDSGDLQNYGSDAEEAADTDATQGQTPLAGYGAYLFDGDTNYVRFANADIPNTKALTTQRWACLCNPTSLGEGDKGMIAVFLNGGAANGPFFGLVDNNALRMSMTNGTDTFIAVSNNNQVQDCIGSACWLFGDYNDTTKKTRLFKGVGGQFTQLTLASDPTVTGSLLTPPDHFYIGNAQVGSRGFDGLMYLFTISAGLWTSALGNALVKGTGV